MALVLNDRVKETTTTTGTGTINLGGAQTNFETFVAGIGNSNTTYYAIVHRSSAEFEVGLGTITDASPDTLARTTIISSSNSDSAVNFSAGTKDVFCTMPASKAVHEDGSSDVTLPNDLILGSDSAVLKFGADSDTTLTHTDGTGLTLNSTNKLLFRDSALGINSSADGQLDLFADTEIQIVATTIDINGNVDVSGDITVGDDLTVEGGVIDLKTNSGSRAQLKLYCESGNAHAQKLQAQPHSAGATNTLTLPDGSDQELVGTTATQTLTNKTLTTPTITTPVVNAGAQLKNGSTSAGFLEFFEDSDNGTNKATLIGPASTADVTITLPAATDTLVGKATTDTLTNKSIDLANNTLTGSLTEFNSALQSESFVGLAATQTLTNKTLTTPTLTTPIANAGVQLKNGATSAGFLEFFEDSDNGTNKVTLIGPASTADVTVTLPAATDTLVGKATTDTLTNKTINGPDNTLTNIANGSLANSSITLNGTAVSLGGSATISAGTDWQAVKTSNFTAAAGEGYFINTSSSAITMTLPSSASIGDEVSFKDYANSFDTYTLTVGRNSHKIEGASADLTISVEGAGNSLVYVDSTKGWLLRNK